MIEYDAVIPAGGRGSRLGGVDKPSLVVRGVSLADRAVASVAGARRVVLVGHRVTSSSDSRVSLAEETPRWSGPVAALAAGLTAIESSSPFTIVLAADLPSASPAVERLLGLAGDATAHGSHAEGVVAVAGGGIRQPLLAVYRSDRLRAAVAAVVESAARRDGRGASMRAVLERMPLLEAVMPEEWCRDLDTPDDAAHFGVTLPAHATPDGSTDDG
ncbi:molybdenum cofactor guanylyltransferase [Agromyces ramosus]|uniref:Molybdopterin-guanine dinucleotide biosynthesis protein A n=1 Tax=Agromyces ramosus TaxID=33879 RepID=A0ABU0R3I2_9MICO|nr:NTP transferase domain-containing protein [Agromyces ramosus]MDQ0892641.1 molybdopterin-guanine dinucleotide biosynthesis protein A [Agromyces ramosus]